MKKKLFLILQICLNLLNKCSNSYLNITRQKLYEQSLSKFHECKLILSGFKDANFTNKTKETKNPKIIFTVNSNPIEFEHRCGIRYSWSHFDNVLSNLYSYKVIFQVGYNNKYNFQMLERENKIYQDLFIHYNVIDHFYNLSLKNIESWKYILKYYKNTKLIVKTDSDVFVNINIYLKHLNYILNSNIVYEGLM